MTCQREGCENALTGKQRRFCSDNCRRRSWDSENRVKCVDCGELLAVNSYGERCLPCEKDRRHVELNERVELVARLYNDGAPIDEIRRALGWNGQPGRLIDEARRRGMIGYRYTRKAEA